MKPFKYPPGTKSYTHKKYARKDRVISRSVKEMELIMRKAVDQIIDHYVQTGHYAEPSLQSMYQAMATFYWHLLHEAYNASAHDIKIPRKDQKRLAAAPPPTKWPVGIPKDLTSLEKIFRDRRYWPKIMKRSKFIVDRVRATYLKKLQRKFRKIQPSLNANEMTPLEAKNALMGEWDATKSRVELIFRTETTTYFGKTQVAFFKNDPQIIGFLFDSILDMARTDWCKSRHGLIYRPGTKELSENTPSLHWNCRSHLIPLANTEYNRKLISDPDRDPTNRKVEPLPPGWRK